MNFVEDSKTLDKVVISGLIKKGSCVFEYQQGGSARSEVIIQAAFARRILIIVAESLREFNTI